MQFVDFGKTVTAVVGSLAWAAYKDLQVRLLRIAGFRAKALRIESQADREMRALCGIPEDPPDETGAWPSYP